MKRNVKVSISGIHNSEADNIEVVSLGEMIQEENYGLITYEELSEDETGAGCEMIKCMLKLEEKHVEVIKKGANSVHLVFIEGQDSLTYFSTPFGELEVVLHTSRLERQDFENGFQIVLEYTMEINSAHVSDCNVCIKVEYSGD